MKKIILIIIVGLIGCQSVYSQNDSVFTRINFGVSGYAGLGTVYNNLSPVRSNETYVNDYKANYLTGLFCKYNITRRSSIELELLYNRINSHWEFYVEYPENVKIYDENLQRKFDYISIPITYQFKIYRFRMNLGTQYSILLKNHVDSGVNSSGVIKSDSRDDYNDITKSDLSLTAFLSYKIYKKINIEARFNQGLINISNLEVWSSDRNIHSRQFLFGLKYCIK